MDKSMMFGSQQQQKIIDSTSFDFFFLFQRYFQCQTNHGIFVPREKVILENRDRIHV